MSYLKRVEMKLPAKLKLLDEFGRNALPQNAKAMERLANIVIQMIRGRIVKKGVDAKGKKLHKLRGLSSGWFYTSVMDKRFQGLKKIGGKMGSDGKRSPPMAVDFKGYGHVKRKMGKPARRTGELTGKMWDSLTPTLKKTKRGWDVILKFTKSQTVGKHETGQFKTKRIEYKRTKTGKLVLRRGKGAIAKVVIKKIPIMKNIKIENRVKAKFLQESKHKGGRQVFELLGVSEKELVKIMAAYLKLVKRSKFFRS